MHDPQMRGRQLAQLLPPDTLFILRFPPLRQPYAGVPNLVRTGRSLAISIFPPCQ
jgi:hypothetical protein